MKSSLRPLRSLLLLGPLSAGVALGDDGGGVAAPVDFARDVRPILSDNCFFCHGPDEARREADLRLDSAEAIRRDLGGYAAVVPGAPAESELFLRVSDPDDPMPPPHSGKSLEPAEVDLLRRWIEEGAVWEEHWAYRAPVRPVPPAVAAAERARNPIDAFVLARLAAEGLTPSPEAAPETLLRRVFLDLTGLPPTPEEVDAYLADDGPDRYGRQVDRLLASPRFGEHMARAWLDAVRYGDTHGYHLDNERSIWPYRDWVVRAFNDNLPFDRFTIEQIAGDLLPEPTRDQLVATGYNRCNPTTAEGGFIPEEFLARYASDRVVTTSTVWLGTTMLCAQCHDHKFDPATQREFYGLFAFFNNTAEDASDGNQPAPPPVLSVPSDEQAAELERLDGTLAELEARAAAPMPAVDARQAAWEDELRAAEARRWTTLAPLAFEARGGTVLELLEDGSLRAGGANPDTDTYELLLRCDLPGLTALRLEVLGDPSCEDGGVGRADNGNFVLTDVGLSAVDGAAPGSFTPLALRRARADYSQAKYAVDLAIDDDPRTGWAVDGLPADRVAEFALGAAFGGERGALLRLRLSFDSQFARHAIGRFRVSACADPELLAATQGPWWSLGPFVEADGDAAFDREHGPEAGVDLTADTAAGRWRERPEWGEDAIHTLEGENCATYVFREIHAPTARAVELSLGSDDAVKVWLNGELLLDARVARPAARDQNRVRLELREGRNELLFKVVNYAGGYAFTSRWAEESLGAAPLDVLAALDDPDGGAVLRDHFRRRHSPEWAALQDELASQREARAAYAAMIPVTLITRERDSVRPAHVLARGQYDRPGDEVQPGTPSFLPPLGRGDDGRATRLDFARWLVSGENPLTARVTVNRFWQELFGTGLVATAEDFGSQGEFPSHPRLLDWLAVEFVESGWDVKALLKTLVTSATYRQASRSTPEQRARDPRNRLLAHGPRFRLDAERLRDSALSISGLLVEHVGGPGVRPYQPSGIWEAVAYTSSNTARYRRDEGEALWRRSLYTFWKRTAPPASMQVFDAPTREACEVARARTNTPLQALALMNDEQFFEAARGLAELVLARDGSPEERLVHAFRRATARRPNERELGVLRTLLERQRERFAAAPEDAARLLAVGASALPEGLDPVELAAWTLVTNTILNLDEVVTRG